ncbi:MAG: hypothetical protein OEV22_20975 [Deltaproteobacteria bacterium]|nr:hypothetical protein [Deltaproteobacteria bacterium]
MILPFNPARIFHESPAATTGMAVLPGVLGCRHLRRTVEVRLGTNPAVPRDELPGTRRKRLRWAWHAHVRGLAIAIEDPCSPPAADRESSKCKVLRPFYCSSLALPVRPRRTTGDALA